MSTQPQPRATIRSTRNDPTRVDGPASSTRN
jgi:hypothetical protein